jgi:hypothetical protein
MDMTDLQKACKIANIEICTLLQYLKDDDMHTIHGVRFNKMIMALTILRDCAESVLKVNGVMPKKTLCSHNSIPCYYDGVDEGCSICISNKTIDDCQLAFAAKQQLVPLNKDDLADLLVIEVLEKRISVRPIPEEYIDITNDFIDKIITRFGTAIRAELIKTKEKP